MAINFKRFRDGLNLAFLSSAPASAVEGDIYFNTTTKELNFHDGTVWQAAASEDYVNAAVAGIDLSVYLKHDGTVPMSGNLNLDGNEIVDVVRISSTGSLDVSVPTNFTVTAAASAGIYANTIQQSADNIDITGGNVVQVQSDGLINFTGVPISILTPTADEHAATKQYVDTAVGSVDAGDVSYSNTVSGLTATNVQDAIDEVEARVQATEIVANAAIPLAQKAANNGVATLDGGGKIPVTQLPSSVMTYEGTWNAATNTPTLTNGTGDAGMVYLVSVAGTVNFGAGPIAFLVGDWAVYSGTIWQKSSNSNSVVSVNGQTGVVVIGTDEVAEGVVNLYFTPTRARTAAVVNSTAGAQTDQAPSVDSIKTYVNTQIAAQTNIAATRIADGSVDNTEFQYLNGVTSPIQTQLTSNATAISDHIADTVDAHDASAISNIPSGNLAATDVQGALNELQTDVDTRATSAALTAHTGASTGVHGVVGAVVGTTDTQTLTNKTIGDALTMTQVATPSNPAAGLNKIYPKADGLFYSLNSAGTETVLGGSSTPTPSGLKNYLGIVNGVNGNGNFELGTTAKWSLFNTTLSAQKIPNGAITAGAPSLVFSATSSLPLAGTYSGSLDASGLVTAGHGLISDAFTLDNEDKTKAFTISFNFESSNISLTGTSANTYAVYLYDVLNSQWVQPSNVYGINQIGHGKFVGEFQTGEAVTSYRLVIVCITATVASPSFLRVDDFTAGPSLFNTGSPVTDRQAYTPIILGLGAATSTLFYRRVGANIEIDGTFTTGTPTAVIASISLPAGLAVDSSVTSSFMCGGPLIRNAADNLKLVPITNPGASIISFGAQTNTNAGTSQSLGNGGDWGTGSIYKIRASVPIQGWSSSVQMSDSADTRVVDFSGSVAVNQAVTANATNITLLAVKDTHSAWTGSAYLVPVPGDYSYGMILSMTTNATYDINIYKNGTLLQKAAINPVAGGANCFGSGLMVNLVAGDVISFRSDTTLTTLASAIRMISFSRISGPSAIAASESIVVSYYCSANASISTTVAANFDTKEIDTHGAVTVGASWKFTAPAGGIYEVNGFQMTTSIAATLMLYKNASVYKSSGYTTTTAASTPSTTVRLFAGETIELRADTAATLTGGTLSTAKVSHISIKRIGL